MRDRSFGFGLVAGSALAAASCGLAGSTPVWEVQASVGGIAFLIETECFEWRSFDWARAQYLQERAACIGEITSASIGDCRANVTGTEWEVRATNAPATFGMLYFFDEVAEPTREEASCHVTLPREFAREGSAAARQVAARWHLRGPYRSGEHGFSIPTLLEYWVDERNRPALGVLDDRGSGDREGITLVRYQQSIRPVQHIAE
jgi:hypothetical protein